MVDVRELFDVAAAGRSARCIDLAQVMARAERAARRRRAALRWQAVPMSAAEGPRLP